MKALQELAVQYGKPVQRILEEAVLKKLATRGEQQWNLHQKWYAICHPITDNEGVKEYHLRQKEHYVTHSDEEEHAALWQDIREHGNVILHSLKKPENSLQKEYKEINPSASVPILDFDVDANVEDPALNTDQELEWGATEGFRDWNQRIVPGMMGKKLKHRAIWMYRRQEHPMAVL
ncbi:hypothetical protein PAXRUDRAFT_29251 [Paxillus rubicundulus Ve08.2h10]|uniref:Uncharacterized protein n=1 Tax=Paxillus rubicundulus Ve08.2h10 TaxID=930991 RepID=A0A0D0D8Q9_9AGAM|nr:hypothetical protein PAXRUDRAFT_29251 [Paxillus rubicundulus Ve08.2h10]